MLGLVLTDDQRVHISSENHLDLARYTIQEVRFKPRGLWYACGDSWISFVRRAAPGLERPNLFRLDLDFRKILQLDDLDAIKDFTQSYQHLSYGRDSRFTKHIKIDWAGVANKYYGMEICPFVNSAAHMFEWYQEFDIASGCIWNPKAIKNITYLGPTALVEL